MTEINPPVLLLLNHNNNHHANRNSRVHHLLMRLSVRVVNLLVREKMENLITNSVEIVTLHVLHFLLTSSSPQLIQRAHFVTSFTTNENVLGNGLAGHHRKPSKPALLGSRFTKESAQKRRGSRRKIRP